MIMKQLYESILSSTNSGKVSFVEMIKNPKVENKSYKTILHIEKIDLINSEKSYTGAEIKYWFLMNNIDLEFGSQYAGFWSFLNPCSKTLLIDNKFYYVSYNVERKQKCQIILDKTKL